MWNGSESITATGSVDIDTPGSYMLSYNYTDTSGNAASTVTRTVTVVDTTAPLISLNGDVSVTHEAGQLYLDDNATWVDHVDGAGSITATGSVDIDTPGSYMLSYNYTDTSGNAASTVTRTVTVVDTTAPVITLNGDANLAHQAGLPYEDAKATWTDWVDGNGTIMATGTVNINDIGVYYLRYDYTDSSGNAASTKYRLVTIFDSDSPVITLNGDQNITHEAGQLYFDENATWSDYVDGTGTITATGIVDIDTPGSYMLSYNYTDTSGNAASTVTRTVTVVDTTAPVISLNGDVSVTHEAGQLYLDENATWVDHVDGAGSITATGIVDIDTPGSYVLSYNYTEYKHNSPVAMQRLYFDDNATWVDIDGNGTITATGSVDIDTPGSYMLSYNYTDTSGNAARYGNGGGYHGPGDYFEW